MESVVASYGTLENEKDLLLFLVDKEHFNFINYVDGQALFNITMTEDLIYQLMYLFVRPDGSLSPKAKKIFESEKFKRLI